MVQPLLSYSMLKFSLQMFHCAPHKLDSHSLRAVRKRAEDECTLQKKILKSKEGMEVVVPARSIKEAMAKIASRYESVDAFEQDLRINNLDNETMAKALEADLAVDATMSLVADRAEPPGKEQVAEILTSAVDEKPEQRCLRHILVTINDQFPDNSRRAALVRITKVREKALSSDVDFSELALRYSECPSALKGGSISPVSRGQIYPSLEETLFKMEAGEISEIVESNMGFHVLRCEKIIAAEKLTRESMEAKIRADLHVRIKKKVLLAWLAGL
ncbi:parvulin-like peptidyl-prolyl isomerase [Desulfocapsa sulfexigens DSM 10523]|uniref:peptidylprolyl isomerase n=1 Tax=Desulfocapsa sulfexigens (strain DSM 10523 / SB164P1) TaxID=1167006 RepID=M1P5F8_DESSD|nr:peptidylprolyl isomerase [Desulfocapsa sulfexigens]AGF76917.1 parvulin-like peptidyl-prolyl isomerase [Desulfocapsa sulfexigens DSM 10523]